MLKFSALYSWFLNKNALDTFKMNLFHKSHLYISHKFL